MAEEIILGGSGGQGILFIGWLLAEAAFLEGREVVYMPSYGAEKRGGIVWCHVTISEEKIGSLFVTRPTVALAMDSVSLIKLETAMKSGGLLVVNESLVTAKVNREDIQVISVPASDLAMEMGDGSVGNLIALGVLLASRPVVSVASLGMALDRMLAKDPERLEVNKRAFHQGYALRKEVRAPSVSSGGKREE